MANFVSDEGTEFKNKAMTKFLNSGGDDIFDYPIHQGFTVPNDRVKNPLAEAFIKTFKRLFGQYTMMKKTDDITQKDVDQIVDFSNSRIHSSTGCTPKEVLEEEPIADALFDIYRHQKSAVYITDNHKPLGVGNYVRIFYKWKTPDKNDGDKKSNIQNWSFTIFKITGLNKADNHYLVEPVGGKKDSRDTKFIMPPPKRGVRKDLVLKIDYDAYKKYN